MINRLKICNKKKSTFEAITGTTFKQFIKNILCILLEIIIIAGAIAIILGIMYLNWKWAKNICSITGKVKDSNLLINCIFTAITLNLLELLMLSIICAIYEFLVYDLPLLLNLRYLPCTKEEILSFEFKSDEEFLEFVKSVCKKKDHYCSFKHMKKEIVALINLYVSTYKKEIDPFEEHNLLERDNELYSYLRNCT